MTAPRFDPVVAIEVDGLLSIPVTRPGHPPMGALEIEVTMRADAYPSRTQAQPAWRPDGTWTTPHWISRTGLAWVRQLIARRVDVVWASTWLDYANSTFGTALGLPHLPIALSDAKWTGDTIGDIKAQQLGRQFDGRPLLLVTDTLPLHGRRTLEQARRPQDRALTRLQLIPWSAPVSEGDITAMDNWLHLAGTAEGHAELRRLRQRDLRLARKRRAQRTAAGERT